MLQENDKFRFSLTRFRLPRPHTSIRSSTASKHIYVVLCWHIRINFYSFPFDLSLQIQSTFEILHTLIKPQELEAFSLFQQMCSYTIFVIHEAATQQQQQ